MNAKPSVIMQDIVTFIPMVRAILKGQYKMPWGTLFWMILCAVYFLSPIDFIPDLLPLLGIADDGAFIVFVLLLLHQDLSRFRALQHQTQGPTIIEAEVVKDEKEGDK